MKVAGDVRCTVMKGLSYKSFDNIQRLPTLRTASAAEYLV